MRKFVVVLICSLAYQNSICQTKTDTLKLDLPSIEAFFLQRNLQLISANYNIEIATALKEQASYWDNPVLNTDQSIYDGQFFKHTATRGQIFVQIQQLIKTAGKRNKLLLSYEDEILKSKEGWKELLRQLKFSITQAYLGLEQSQSYLTLNSNEAQLLSTLVKASEERYQKGYISLKELTRVQALQQLNSKERFDIQTEVLNQQQYLKALLRIQNDTFLVAETGTPIPASKFTLEDYNGLLDSANKNRPDLNLAKLSAQQSLHNLNYQKSLVYPDITAGVEYDRLSSYLPNYYGLSISLPIPLFNKNKGNIKAASAQVLQQKVQTEDLQQSIEKEVWASLSNYLNVEKLLMSGAVVSTSMQEMMQKMTESYQNRQINFLEFIDFFQTYKESNKLIIDRKLLWWQSFAQLNYSTNTTLQIIK